MSDIHFIADKQDSDTYYNGEYKKQILFNNDSGSNLQLVLGANLQGEQHNVISTSVNDTILAETNASDKYYRSIYTGTLTSSVSLDKTVTENDSIKLVINSLVWNSTVEKELLGDTFALWLALETPENKVFNIAENYQYTLGETVNTTPVGTLSVVGKSNSSSVFYAYYRSLFYFHST